MKGLTVLAALVLATPVWAQHEHEGDVEAGRTESGVLGALVVQDAPAPLYPFSQFGLNGWTADEPGFMAIDVAEGELLPLEEGALVMLEVVSLAPAFNVLDPNGLNEIPVGGRFELGGPGFDTHPIWFIDSDDADYDENQDAWEAEFRLVDQGETGYADSEVFTLSFTTGCTGQEKIKTRCKDKGVDRNVLILKVKQARPDSEHTVVLDGVEEFDLDIHDDGQGQLKIKFVADGAHAFVFDECGYSGEAGCE